MTGAAWFLSFCEIAKGERCRAWVSVCGFEELLLVMLVSNVAVLALRLPWVLSCACVKLGEAA